MGLKLNGTTGALVHSSKLVSAFPFSIGAWIAVDGTADSFAVSHGQSNADRDATIFLDNNGSSKYARYRNVGIGSNATKSFSNVATYVFAVAVFESTTSRKMYFGSNVPATDTASLADNTTSHNQLVIGANFNNAASGLFLNGGVAEIHVWGVAIDATQYENMRTDAVKPESIAGWVDGWTLQTYSAGGTYTSIGGARTLTAQGGVTAEPSRVHPISRTIASTTIACTVGAAAASGALAFIQGSVTVAATVGNAAAAGQTATITNSIPSTTVACAVGNAAAAGLSAAFGTFIQSDQLINNTGTLLPATAVYWTWTPAGRTGSMAGITAVDGTGTTDANARLAPGIARVAGKLDIAVRAAAAIDDAMYTEMFA